ncbi:MAG: hypothetical protein NTV51_31065 [Verrucomicrobia bacterium]|nr:hypothetical protein [Verrucomicrobiota bacterium]
MKQLMAIGLVWLVGLTAVRAADEAFSRTVRAEDFSAAGLGKLSPEELTRLDALVRDYKSGALAAARQEAAAAAEARVAAEAKAARAEAETQAAKAEALKSETARAAAAKAAKEQAEVAKAEAAKAKKAEGGSLLSRAKVLLTPGTEIEYATVESRIRGDFKGWEGKAILTLEDGSRWQIANGGSYMTPPLPSPKVKIEPSSLGGFWMKIEGVASRVKVLPLGTK